MFYYFLLHRDLGNECWMKSKLYIDIDIVKFGRPIPYKYVVYSPSREGANQYEYFHDSPKNLLTDRCLIVPQDSCMPNGKSNSVIIIEEHNNGHL